MTAQPKTLYQKIWDKHFVDQQPRRQPLIYIDLHLVHEVTSPQAFEGLRLAGRKVRRPERTVATEDHNVPTTDRSLPIVDQISLQQIETLRANCKEFGVKLYDLNSINQGIVHIIGPELGYTQPGMTIVCGDSHTATHGAFGALAFGIGTSEVEHVLATQTLPQSQSKTFELRVEGELGKGVSAKDLILYLIGQIGTSGGTGYTLEFTGSAVRNLSMEGRMTVCNMAIEAGARAGLVAADQTTVDYLQGRDHAPKGEQWDKAVKSWQDFVTDPGATYDRSETYKAADIVPQVTWGTSPGQVTGISSSVPNPSDFSDPVDRKAAEDALSYMGLTAGTPMEEVPVDQIFIGSCTNARIEDLREAAAICKGYKIAESVDAMVVPGSGLVRRQAEEEGLDKIFLDAGFQWRQPGCSMCLAMNPDQLAPGQRCASTSNRNFEGRQGKDGRTHLVSPAMAAAAGIKGHFTDVRNWEFK